MILEVLKYMEINIFVWFNIGHSIILFQIDLNQNFNELISQQFLVGFFVSVPHIFYTGNIPFLQWLAHLKGITRIKFVKEPLRSCTENRVIIKINLFSNGWSSDVEKW